MSSVPVLTGVRGNGWNVKVVVDGSIASVLEFLRSMLQQLTLCVAVASELVQ